MGVEPDFADRVMAGVRRSRMMQTAGIGHSLWSYVTTHSWARAAVLVGGALLALTRIAVTIHLVLFA